MKYAVPVLLALSLGIACNRTETKAAATTRRLPPVPPPRRTATPARPATPGSPAGGRPHGAARRAGRSRFRRCCPPSSHGSTASTIAAAELEKAIRNLEANVGNQIPAERRSEIYRGILDQLVEMRLLEQEAAARNIKADRRRDHRGHRPDEEAGAQSRGRSPRRSPRAR